MPADTTRVVQMSGSVPQLFPSLGPALMVSMGYIDLGKMFAAVDGGARSGSDLVFMVLLFNLSAIFCQYLAISIGVVTGKNLAQICNEEYIRIARILLGIQVEVSVIISDLTSILGIAHGINLLLGVDISTCILFAVISSVLLPYFVTRLDSCKAEVLYIGISGFALLFFLLGVGVFISQPETLLFMNGIFPRLSGESAYPLMALLGSNIMVHNFYTHSSIVQQQIRAPNVAVGAVIHEHFFAVLFIFSGIFLVNYVLMNSAPSVFGTAGLVLTFQDVFLLMDQVFRTPVASVAFFLVIIFSSLVTAITWNLGGRGVLDNLFGIDISASVHHVFIKTLAIVPALYCAQYTGAEGIYQLLILCQVILAMLLPSSVIPLFRVATSRLMGAFKISWYLEILALLAFFGMLASNIIFVIEMLFGNSSWMVHLQGDMSSSLALSFVVLVLISCTSLCLTLYLVVTPLKSASDRPDMQMWTRDFKKDQQQLTEDREETDLNKVGFNEGQEFAAEPVELALEKPLESQSSNSMLELNIDMEEVAIDSNHRSQQSTDIDLATTAALASNLGESNTKLDPLETSDKVSDAGITQTVESTVDINVQLESEAQTQREVEQGDALKPESSSEIFSSSTSEGTLSSKNMRDKGEDLGSGSGSLSRLSGLGRATRRQFVAILDEFWGHLFDFHGQLTQEAIAKRVDVLLGLDLKTTNTPLKGSTSGNEFSKRYLPEAARELGLPTNSREYNSPKQQSVPRLDSSYGIQMGSPSWSSNMQLLNALGQRSWHNLPESGERRYSSLHLPQYSDSREYQPATLHGSQMPFSLRGLAGSSYSDSSSISVDALPTPKAIEAYVPNYRDPFAYTLDQNRLGSSCISGFNNPVVSRASGLQVGRPYYDTFLVGTNDGDVSSAYSKKYHSLPDISGLSVSSRNSSSNDINVQWVGPISSRNSSLNDINVQGYGPIGQRVPAGRKTLDQSQYSNSVSRNEGSRLAFDNFSPSKIYRDALSLQSSTQDTNSFWSGPPSESLFGMDNIQNQEDGVANKQSLYPIEAFSYAESENKFLQSFKFCIIKLLKLEGSDWLFRQNGGADEDLIDRVAGKLRFLYEADASDVNQVKSSDPQYLCSDQKPSLVQRNNEVDFTNFFPLPNCGESCIWRTGLVVSFGVWCILRILELSLLESRPELWGKYTYVLNRLQGILEPAFSKPRSPTSPCPCLEIPAACRGMSSLPLQKRLPHAIGKICRGQCTSAIIVLEIIKDVESAISGRKGRMGTAAGDVAFPKGKENLASVLKRYKRRLSNKTPGTRG